MRSNQAPDRLFEELPPGYRDVTDLWKLGEHRVRGVAVGGEVVVAAEQVGLAGVSTLS
jgi:hypothetical protein